MYKRTDVCTFSAVWCKTEKLQNDMSHVNLQASLRCVFLICLTWKVIMYVVMFNPLVMLVSRNTNYVPGSIWPGACVLIQKVSETLALIILQFSCIILIFWFSVVMQMTSLLFWVNITGGLRPDDLILQIIVTLRK